MGLRRWLAGGLAIVAAGGVAVVPAGAAVVLPNPAIYLASADSGNAQVFTGLGVLAGSVGVGDFDGFGVGDVTGDGIDEFVVADRDAGLVTTLTADGTRIAQFPVDLEFGFDLAVGDTNADGRDDIVLRRDDFLPVFSSVDVFDPAGTRLGGVGGLTITAFAGVGDADGDGAGDLWVHDQLVGRMAVYNLSGTQLGTVSLGFDPDSDGLAVGDLTGDRVSELVVGNALTGQLRVLSHTGTVIKAFPGFVTGASLSIGDVDGDDANDIAIARPATASGVTVINMSGQRILRFDAAFAARDGFAVRSRPADRAVSLGSPKPGFHQVVLGVAADDVNVYATHFYQSQSDPHISDGPGNLVVLDRTTLKLKARIPVGFAPRSVAVNPVTHKVYVLNGFEPGVPSAMKINVIDRDALAVVNTITLVSGQPSTDIAVNSNLNRIYVSNTPAGRIQVIDGASSQELAPILIGPGPVGIAVDETTNTVHVALNNRVTEPFVTALGSVIDSGGNYTILPPVDLGPVGTQPVDVAVDPINNRIFTANLGGGDIHPSATVLDATTRSVIARLPLKRPGRAIAANPAADQVFVAGEENVYVIGARSLTMLRTIPAELPFAIAAPAGSDRHVYTGDLRSGLLNRYSYTAGE